MKPLKEWDSVDPSPPLGPALLIISYRHSSHLIDPLYISIGLSDIPKCGHIIFDTLKPNHVDWMQATRIIFSLYLDMIFPYIIIYIYISFKGTVFLWCVGAVGSVESRLESQSFNNKDNHVATLYISIPNLLIYKVVSDQACTITIKFFY